MGTTDPQARFAGRHVLHPPLVHLPIGAVIATALCDIVSTAGGPAHAWARAWFKVGSFTLMIGTAMLLIAAIAGLIDRARSTAPGGADRHRVNRHALVMAAVGPLSMANVVLRSVRYPAALHTPIASLLLSLAAVTFTVVGAELGGRLVYRRGVGVAGTSEAGSRGIQG